MCRMTRSGRSSMATGAPRAARRPGGSRQALLMHHVEGWSFVEIAARLGIRVNAAKTRVFRGMKKMREYVKMRLRHRRTARPIKRDLRPTRPLKPPFVRALVLSRSRRDRAFGSGTALLPFGHGRDRVRQGVGLFVRSGARRPRIVGAALRESIPGRGLSRTRPSRRSRSGWRFRSSCWS